MNRKSYLHWFYVVVCLACWSSVLGVPYLLSCTGVAHNLEPAMNTQFAAPVGQTVHSSQVAIQEIPESVSLFLRLMAAGQIVNVVLVFGVMWFVFRFRYTREKPLYLRGLKKGTTK